MSLGSIRGLESSSFERVGFLLGRLCDGNPELEKEISHLGWHELYTLTLRWSIGKKRTGLEIIGDISGRATSKIRNNEMLNLVRSGMDGNFGSRVTRTEKGDLACMSNAHSQHFLPTRQRAKKHTTSLTKKDIAQNNFPGVRNVEKMEN